MSPRQSSGCRPARAQNVPGDVLVEHARLAVAARDPVVLAPERRQEHVVAAGASAPGAWAISHST